MEDNTEKKREKYGWGPKDCEYFCITVLPSIPPHPQYNLYKSNALPSIAESTLLSAYETLSYGSHGDSLQLTISVCKLLCSAHCVLWLRFNTSITPLPLGWSRAPWLSFSLDSYCLIHINMERKEIRATAVTGQHSDQNTSLPFPRPPWRIVKALRRSRNHKLSGDFDH